MNKCVAKEIETNFQCVYTKRTSKWMKMKQPAADESPSKQCKQSVTTTRWWPIWFTLHIHPCWALEAANELWCGSVTSDWLFIQKWTFNEFRRYVDGLTKSGVKLEAADRRLNWIELVTNLHFVLINLDLAIRSEGREINSKQWKRSFNQRAFWKFLHYSNLVLFIYQTRPKIKDTKDGT